VRDGGKDGRNGGAAPRKELRRRWFMGSWGRTTGRELVLAKEERFTGVGVSAGGDGTRLHERTSAHGQVGQRCQWVCPVERYPPEFKPG
jgi:hypothetical protein